jgi:hypothetical protein
MAKDAIGRAAKVEAGRGGIRDPVSSGQALEAAWTLDLQAQASPHLQAGPQVQGWHWQGSQGQGLVM